MSMINHWLGRNRTTLWMRYQCDMISAIETTEHACDDEMLQELDMLEPKDIRERVDRKLVRPIIVKEKAWVGYRVE